MEITYYGGNCIRIANKKVSIIVDDVNKIGLKSLIGPKDIQLVTDPRFIKQSTHKPIFKVDQPGEYEVSEVSIAGVPARSHLDEEKTFNATMYRIILEDTRIAVVGHIHPDLTEDQLELLGTVDILVLPVGGNGLTLDALGAQKVIRKIEPKIIIPVHYDDGKDINYEVPQQDLDTVLKTLSMEPAETVDVLKIKNIDLADKTRLVIINRKK